MMEVSPPLSVPDVVTLFLEGLRKRSKYAVGTQSYQPAGQVVLLERGDLVRLAVDHTGQTLTTSLWCSGKAGPDWARLGQTITVNN